MFWSNTIPKDAGKPQCNAYLHYPENEAYFRFYFGKTQMIYVEKDVEILLFIQVTEQFHPKQTLITMLQFWGGWEKSNDLTDIVLSLQFYNFPMVQPHHYLLQPHLNIVITASYPYNFDVLVIQMKNKIWQTKQTNSTTQHWILYPSGTQGYANDRKYNLIPNS